MLSDRRATAGPAAGDGDGDGDAQSTPRSRRRGATLEHAILDAAWDELAAVGSTDLTVAAVAARAGTSKAVLYRRWPNRTELLAAAVNRRVAHLAPPAPDSGSLRGDVTAVLEAMNRHAQGARIIPDVNGELAAYLRRQAHAAGLEQMTLVLDRAGRRGEIDPLTLPPRIARLPIDLLYTELSLRAEPVPLDLIAEIVDDVFLPLAVRRASHGARPHQPVRSPE